MGIHSPQEVGFAEVHVHSDIAAFANLPDPVVFLNQSPQFINLKYYSVHKDVPFYIKIKF